VLRKHIFTPENSFFDSLVVYISSVASLGMALEGYAENRVRVNLCKDNEYLTITGKPEVTGIELRLRPAPILRSLAKNLWPESIEIEETEISSVAPCKHLLTNIHSIHGAVISNCFISFYEKYCPRKDESPLWSFAYAIRNGLAHNGEILIRNPAEVLKWRGMEFSSADNGKPLLYEKLTAVELIVLMMELDNELLSSASQVE
jgi:hypothetical protein